ncbi:RsmB/NOP family class I SAM-dependent RNA methyltransferase [Roseivivax isoporae]|uniref:16S rRNA methyltransferase n=1 Tax=Roseivivax isoporae LMG 25204 TaxID=1449351 RepID=X7F6P1_9RHOB|nr:transcription antitermination factor NusB [Roseivivax isoporae]ETX28465.1 16S rRNA methyltransferase [Roseivivax isoporae LMG 25204]
MRRPRPSDKSPRAATRRDPRAAPAPQARGDGPSPARRAAIDLLGQVLGEGRLLSEALAGPRVAALAPEDRAAAQRLATSVLRELPRADAVLAPFLRKAPPLRVRNALRLATLEIARGGAAHGVVNDAVAIVAASKKTEGFRGLANAVLRQVAEAAPDLDALPVPKLPGWLRAPLVAAWGRADVAAMERAHLAGAPLDLSVKDDAAGWAARLGGTVLPGGSVRLATQGQVSALEGYDEGAWWVQDAAAAWPVRMLGDVGGLDVLDLCAAPGGKTLQLAAGGARVTALDASAGRMARLEENLARTGLAAEIVVADALTYEGGPFDAVLLDAPCSATGTIRRHPDLPHARQGEGISELIALQAQMIDAALARVAPGGRLVFCTCSLIPDEGEVQVEEALARHPGLVVEDVLPEGADPAWRNATGGLRLRPDRWAAAGGMDGFYMACLRVPG